MKGIKEEVKTIDHFLATNLHEHIRRVPIGQLKAMMTNVAVLVDEIRLYISKTIGHK